MLLEHLLKILNERFDDYNVKSNVEKESENSNKFDYSGPSVLKNKEYRREYKEEVNPSLKRIKSNLQYEIKQLDDFLEDDKKDSLYKEFSKVFKKTLNTIADIYITIENTKKIVKLIQIATISKKYIESIREDDRDDDDEDESLFTESNDKDLRSKLRTNANNPKPKITRTKKKKLESNSQEIINDLKKALEIYKKEGEKTLGGKRVDYSKLYTLYVENKSRVKDIQIGCEKDWSYTAVSLYKNGKPLPKYLSDKIDAKERLDNIYYAMGLPKGKTAWDTFVVKLIFKNGNSTTVDVSTGESTMSMKDFERHMGITGILKKTTKPIRSNVRQIDDYEDEE